MPKPDLSELYYVGQWKSPVLGSSTWFNWARPDVFSRVGVGILPHSGNLFITDGHQIYYKKDWVPLIEKGKVAAMQNNSAFFLNYFKLSENATRELLIFAQKIGKKKSFENPAVEIKEFFRLFLEVTSFWCVVFPISEGVEQILNQKAQQLGFSSEQLAGWCAPVRQNELIRQQSEAKLIGKRIENLGIYDAYSLSSDELFNLIKKKDFQLADVLLAHVSEFGWVGTHNFWGESFNLEKLFAQLHELSAKNHKPKRSAIPKELKTEIELVQSLAFYRLDFADSANRSIYRCQALFAAFAKKHGFDFEDFVWMSNHELLDLEKGAWLVSKKEIAIRKEKYGVIVENAKMRVIVGKELDELQDYLLDNLAPVQKEVRGTPASKGKATGRVCVVTTPEESKLVQKGDVLVAPETTPDFVPAMHRAVAVVTEYGGLTSHAAIICREFGIPCIVGAKAATRSLKTGQIVEVDAEKGIVKKI